MSVDYSHTKRSPDGAFKRKTASRQYVPDLSSFMSLCDANYAKMMQLLPEFGQQDERSFGLSRSSHHLGEIRITISERCKYTTTLEIRQSAHRQDDDQKSESRFLTEASMQVRLYHDARMAEVMSYQGIGNLKANYSYPNQSMMQRDEKALCNEFLADWLSYCLKFGHSQQEISV